MKLVLLVSAAWVVSGVEFLAPDSDGDASFKQKAQDQPITGHLKSKTDPTTIMLFAGAGCCKFDEATASQLGLAWTEKRCAQACLEDTNCVAADLTADSICRAYSGDVHHFGVGCDSAGRCFRKTSTDNKQVLDEVRKIREGAPLPMAAKTEEEGKSQHDDEDESLFRVGDSPVAPEGGDKRSDDDSNNVQIHVDGVVDGSIGGIVGGDVGSYDFGEGGYAWGSGGVPYGATGGYGGMPSAGQVLGQGGPGGVPSVVGYGPGVPGGAPYGDTGGYGGMPSAGQGYGQGGPGGVPSVDNGGVSVAGQGYPAGFGR